MKAGARLSDEAKAKMLAGRLAAKEAAARNPRKRDSVGENKTEADEELVAVAKWLPSKASLFKAAFNGGKAAAIKAKCLQCSCYQVAEVTGCRVRGCVLWAIRPWQGKKAAADVPVE